MVYALPPRFDTRPVAAIYRTAESFVPVPQLSEYVQQYTIRGLHSDGLNAWIADLRRRVFSRSAGMTYDPVATSEVSTHRSSEALKRILDRTGWSLRKASEFLGCSHAQIARLRDGRSHPRDNLVRRIAEADEITNALFPVADRDPSTLNRMLFSRPIDGATEAAADAFLRADVRRAMSLARRVRYPRIEEIVNVPESPFSKYDAAKAYLDEE